MRRALKIREKLYGEQPHPDLAASLGNLGLLYFRLGAYEEAEEPLRHALEILNGLAAKDSAYLLGASNVRRTLASLYASQGKFDEAEGLLQRVIDDCRKRFGNDSVEVAEAMATLGEVDLDGKRFKEAEGWFSRALEIQSRKLPASHDEILRDPEFSGDLFSVPGELRAGPADVWRRSLPVCLEKLGKDHPLTIAVTHNLGMTLVTLGEKTRAQEHAREFLNLLSDNLENVLAYFPENRRLGFVQNMGFSPYDLAATLGDGPLTADAVLTFKAAVLESVARDRRRALLSQRLRKCQTGRADQRTASTIPGSPTCRQTGIVHETSPPRLKKKRRSFPVASEKMGLTGLCSRLTGRMSLRACLWAPFCWSSFSTKSIWEAKAGGETGAVPWHWLVSVSLSLEN